MQTPSPFLIAVTPLRHFAVGLGVMLAVANAHAFDLKVTIQNTKTTDGKVRIALFEKMSGWLGSGAPVQVQALQPQSESTVWVFRDLPAGRYAISAFHDKNGNEKLDTNTVGMNIEPIAFSRDARGRMGPPKFEDAAFDLNLDMAITLTLK